MKQYLSLCAVAVFLLLILPTTSHAYTTSEQTVKRLTPLTALYTITYSFGHASRDFKLPAATERGVGFEEKTNRVGYSVTTPSNSTSAVRTAAMIVSDAPLQNGFYHVPAGTAAAFTLVAMVRSEDAEQPGDYGIAVTNLPFVSVINGAEVQQGLNQIELNSYRTAAVELNPAN